MRNPPPAPSGHLGDNLSTAISKCLKVAKRKYMWIPAGNLIVMVNPQCLRLLKPYV